MTNVSLRALSEHKSKDAPCRKNVTVLRSKLQLMEDRKESPPGKTVLS